MEPLLGWDDGRRHGNNNWDLNAVVRFGGRGPISPPTRTNNPVVERYAPPPPPPPPPPLSYAATVLFDGFLGHQAISALPQPQQALDQDLPHPHAAAAGWGPSLDLPPLLPEPPHYAAAVGGSVTPVHQAPPLLNPPLPRNEIPVPSVVQPPPADKHTTAPSSSSVRDAAEGSSRSKKRIRRTKAKDTRKEIRVPANDPTPPDSWAWRKYGEKKIKDTPHHRSYYRCSTDRSCKARKHVQRCLEQPSYLEVSYVSEHSHPVPLALHCHAGTTRPKTPPPPPPRQPTSRFVIRNNPAREKEKQPLASAPAAPATSPFAMIPAAAAQAQQRTPAAPPASASSASMLLLPAVSAPSASLMPLVCNCHVCTTGQKAPLPLPPSPPVIEIPSRESQPLVGPPLLAPVPYSLSPNITPLPPSPLLNIPAVEEQQQTPALPANASAWPPSNAPLPPVSPLLSLQAEEWPTQVPAPQPSVVSTLMSPTTLLPPPSVEFDNEDDDDAVALRMLLEDMDMDMTHEENMIYPMAYDEPASDGSGSGSNNSLMFPSVQTLTANVVNEIFSPRRHDERLPPLQSAAASYWDFEW